MSSTYWRQKHVQHHQSCGRNCQWLNKKKNKKRMKMETPTATPSVPSTSMCLLIHYFELNFQIFLDEGFERSCSRYYLVSLVSLMTMGWCVCVWMLRVLIKSNLKAKTFVAYQNDDHQEEVVPSHPIRIENIWFKDLQVPMRLNAFKAFWGRDCYCPAAYKTM